MTWMTTMSAMKLKIPRVITVVVVVLIFSFVFIYALLKQPVCASIPPPVAPATPVDVEAIKNGVAEHFRNADAQKYSLAPEDLESLPVDLLRCDNCHKWQYPILMEPRKDLCTDPWGKPVEIDLVILCSSKHANREHRMVQREMYNSPVRGKEIRLIFVFAQESHGDEQLEEHLRQESMAHNDILQIAANGTYQNLTLPVFNGYDWTLRNCPRVKFTAKVSDDQLLNVEGVVDLLDQKGKTELHDVAFGYCWMLLHPFRFPKNHKQYLTYKQYPFALFPPFCCGASLMLSRQVLIDVMTNAGNIAFPTTLDDANVGILLYILGYKTCNIPSFDLRKDKLIKLFTSNKLITDQQICDAVKSNDFPFGIHLHDFNPRIMKAIWSNCGYFKQRLRHDYPLVCPRRQIRQVKPRIPR